MPPPSAKAYEEFFENKGKELCDSRRLQQWLYTLNTYVLPKIGVRPVADITHTDVITVLEPIWFAVAPVPSCGPTL